MPAAALTRPLGSIALVAVALTSYSPSIAGAQEPPCQMKVVSCNYAHLYSGQFSWTSTLRGPESQLHEQVTVTVKSGVADCLGTVRTTDQGRTKSETISGPGLFAVEFERDSADSLVYRITAACPPPTGAGSPAQRAELGHNDRETYQQRATKIGQNELKGGSNYPAPETDEVNHVTGTVQVAWNITRPDRVAPDHTRRELESGLLGDGCFRIARVPDTGHAIGNGTLPLPFTPPLTPVS